MKASHRPYGNKYDTAVDQQLMYIRSFDPAFQCPDDLSPRALVVHLAGIEDDSDSNGKL